MILAHQVAVVTGASRGIGRAIALALAKAGAVVLVNYASNRNAADEVVHAITNSGGQAMAVQGDVSHAEAAEALINAAIEHYGRVDILVNNAGVTRDTLLMRMKEEDWDAVLNTNLKGVFHCTKAAIRPMLKQRSGRIINISSVVALMGNVGQANYAAAKAGILGFTKSMAREVAPRNITVNAVCPGYIDTDMTRVLSEDVRNAAVSHIPLGRMGHAEEVASAVVFLAGPGANYITGQVLAVDGGLTMQ